MNNVAEAFAKWLEEQGLAVLGQNLFIGRAPSSNKVDDAVWWVVAVGGTPTRAATGETRNQYSVTIFYRNRDYRQVYNCTQKLHELLNCADCVDLEGYETIGISAEILMVDDDLDAEDRKLGTIQALVDIVQRC